MNHPQRRTDVGRTPRFAPSSPFGRGVRRRGTALLRASESQRYASSEQKARAALGALALALAYVHVLTRPADLQSLGWAALVGALLYNVMATVGHDASHASFFRGAAANRWALATVFALGGISGALWGRRHVRVHHVFPNVAGTDIDADSTALVRLSPHVPWRAWHRYQPLYAPGLYALVLFHLALYEDFSHFRRARQEAPHRFRGAAAVLVFGLSKALHLALLLGLPLWLVQGPAVGILAGYALGSATASLLFVVINIGTHISHVASFVMPPESGRLPHDWATHQALTAVDWAPRNRWAIALTGGANSHAAHHLFPEAAHCHNAELSKVIAQEASKHGVPHHVLSFWGMLGGHFRQLRSLSQRPSAAVD